MIAGTVLLCPTTSTTLPPWRTAAATAAACACRVVRRSYHYRRQMEACGERSGRFDASGAAPS